MGGLTGRFVADPVAALAFGAYLVALVLLLAIDLDQRLLPSVFTLPLVLLAFVFSAVGLNPLVPQGVHPQASLAPSPRAPWESVPARAPATAGWGRRRPATAALLRRL